MKVFNRRGFGETFIWYFESNSQKENALASFPSAEGLGNSTETLPRHVKMRRHDDFKHLIVAILFSH
jgi:hypothetical protein